MRLMASLGAGHCDTTVDTLRNTPFTDVNDCETEVQAAGHAAFDVAARLLPLLGDFMRAVTVDEARVRRHIDEACIAITEFADSLVRAEGIAFRQAHEIAAKVARRAIDSGAGLSSLPFAEIAAIFVATAGRPLRVPEAELRRFTTPEHFVAVRERFGGPGARALAASLGRYRATLAAQRQEAAGAAARVAAAARALDAAVDARLAKG